MAALAAAAHSAPDTAYVQQLEIARQHTLAQNNPDAPRGRASASSDMSHDAMMTRCHDMMSDGSSKNMGGMRMRPMREDSAAVPSSEAFFNKANGGVSPP